MSATGTKVRRPSIEIGSLSVEAGRKATGELPISRLITGTRISLPLQIVHGRSDGPTVWLSAAVHGDEIAGVEIIRQVIKSLNPKTVAGTVLAVPIVNVHGFLTGDRYLPDRRDLNRSFPGSSTGSLAARIANLFMKEIVSRCRVGIDLHTGSDHRTNLPHIRADLDDEETHSLARAFGAPLVMHARARDGSLREAATQSGAKVLLYEGGEAWRFDSDSIRIGVAGIRRVFCMLGLLADGVAPDGADPIECRKSSWMRARRSGIVRLQVALGDHVSKGQALGLIHDSVGRRLAGITARVAGVVIGVVQHPLVNQGDAILHIAVPEEK